MGAGGNMCCPPAIQPPTPTLAKCKRFLQGLGLGLIPLAVLSLAAGQAFQFFIFLILLFLLFISWRSLNWCSVLFFFFYCIMQLVQASIIIAGYIQYNRFFGNKYIVQSVYLLTEEIYFVVAIFLSHYVYRMFKSYTNGQRGVPFNNNNDNPGNAPILREPPPREEERHAINRSQNFRGEGVRIG